MNETKRKWYSEIVLLHCMGMIMIFSAHIAHANGYYNVGELLITGVPLFLFVSGFLVGAKPTLHNMAWLARKAKRILVPYYILLIVVLGTYLILQPEPFQIEQWLVLFANMQGLTNFVFYNDVTGYYAPLAQGVGHFWFVTVIMLCYLVVPLFEKFQEFNFWKKHQISIIIFIIAVLQPVLLYYNVQICYVVIFFLGYLFAQHKMEMTSRRFIGLTTFMLAFFAARLVARNYIDGTVIYNHYIANLSNCTIGLWLVALLFWLRQISPSLVDGIASWKIVVWIESIIYEVYLVHHIIIKGSWSFYHFGLNLWLATAIVLIVTIILSLLLKSASKFLSSKIIL